MTHDLDSGASHDRAAGAKRPAGRQILGRGKKLCFAVLVVAAFFLLLEAILASSGVRPLLYERDPYVGFSSDLPLFVERPSSHGQTMRVTADNRLRMFNRQEFPAVKPDGTYRVFCMGGSTTYGRPYNDATSFAGWMREFLPAADSTRRWEVINAGGISYASYRVALLMEELVRYQPDLFIIYSGHNEFLESRTYRGLRETPLPVRFAHSKLAATRTFSLLERLLKPELAERPEGWAKDLLPPEVDAVLDHTVGPESYHRDEVWQQQVLQHYRFSLQRMAILARSAGARIIYVTPASNLRDFEPFKSEHRADLSPADRNVWLGLVHQAGEAYDAGDFEAALARLDQAGAMDPRHARWHFLRGEVLHQLGRYGEAKQAFQRARDEDVCPLRALTAMESIVAQVAEEQAAPLVDFVDLVEQRAEHGIPGDDWFLDHVHATIEGYRLLALELMQCMQAMGELQPDASWGPTRSDEVSRRIHAGLQTHDHANALRNLAKVLRWAGKFEESSRLALMAVEDLAGDDEAHRMAGDAWWSRGDLDAAEAEYLKAIHCEPNDVWSLLQLGSVLIQQGDPQAALNYLERAVRIAGDRADPHFRLASALQAAHQYERAEAEYREALRYDPRLVNAHRHLAEMAIENGKLAAAVRHLEQAAAIDPANASVHCELGWVLLSQAKMQAAADEFAVAALLDPLSARALAGLAEIAEREGREQEAARLRQQVQEMQGTPRGDFKS